MSPKTTQNIQNILKSSWMSALSKISNVVTLSLGLFVIASGKGMVKDTVTKQIQDTMAPTVAQIYTRLDSMEAKGEARDKRAENTDKKIDALIGIIIDVVPGAKASAQQRAEKEKEAKEVREALIGGNQ